MLEFINNIMFWIIAFFTSVILLIMLFVLLIFIKMKTHAMIELKAFFKKAPVSIFFDDGRVMDVKVVVPDSGIIDDKEKGVFIRNKANSYIAKQTRAMVDIYDASFSPGISIDAAHAAEVLKKYISEEKDFLAIGDMIAKGQLEDEKIDCIRSNVNVSYLKDLYNNIEPHNISATIQKKVAKFMRSMNEKTNTAIILTFIAVFGAIIGGYILLKMFNV